MSDRRHLHRYDVKSPTRRPTSISELAILQKHHQFIRDEQADSNNQQHQQPQASASSSSLSWEDKLAMSWYSKLFREYALCDLTQYKTGGVAMRWRLESEVLDRVGELTCGNLHCKYHQPVESPDDRLDEDDMRPLVPRELVPYQLNFQYQEQGKTKQALVKVVLCSKCKPKLTWKKDQEKLAARQQQLEGQNERKLPANDGKLDAYRQSGRDKGKQRAQIDDLEEDCDRSHRLHESRGTRAHRTRSERSRSPNAQEFGSEGRRRQRNDSDALDDWQGQRHQNYTGIADNTTGKAKVRTVVTSLRGKYYDAILAGTKTWEGRTNTEKYAVLRPNDRLVFHHAEDATKPTFTVLIKDVEKTDTFRDMLADRVPLFLPGVDTLEDAVEIYESLPGYSRQVKKYGAVAFKIEVLDVDDV